MSRPMVVTCIVDSVRRIKVAMASACPYPTEYHLAYLYLRRAAF
jgi:hypothetical protein